MKQTQKKLTLISVMTMMIMLLSLSIVSATTFSNLQINTFPNGEPVIGDTLTSVSIDATPNNGSISLTIIPQFSPPNIIGQSMTLTSGNTFTTNVYNVFGCWVEGGINIICENSDLTIRITDDITQDTQDFILTVYKDNTTIPEATSVISQGFATFTTSDIEVKIPTNYNKNQISMKQFSDNSIFNLYFDSVVEKKNGALVKTKDLFDGVTFTSISGNKITFSDENASITYEIKKSYVKITGALNNFEYNASNRLFLKYGYKGKGALTFPPIINSTGGQSNSPIEFTLENGNTFAYEEITDTVFTLFDPVFTPEMTAEEIVSQANNSLVNVLVLFIIIGVVISIVLGIASKTGILEEHKTVVYVLMTTLIAITIIVLIIAFQVVTAIA